MIALRFPFVRRCIIVDFAASRRNRKYSIEEEFWVLFLPLSLSMSICFLVLFIADLVLIAARLLYRVSPETALKITMHNHKQM